MEINQEIEQDNVSSDSKSKKERSAAHPAYTLENSLNFVGEFYKQFRSNSASRDDIFNLVKGASNSRVGCCGYYGLLNRDKDGYQVSNLYKTIANYLTETEKKSALLQAFISPTLNKELVDKFDGDVVPDNLHVHLSRFHRITEDKAPVAAEVFISTAKYVGVLDDANKLNYRQTLSRLSGSPTATINNVDLDANPTFDEVEPKALLAADKGELKATHEPTTIRALIPETTNEEKLSIKLTDNRRATLSYPRDLNEKDISILKLQLEALALSL